MTKEKTVGNTEITGRGANTGSKKIVRTQKKVEFAYEINKRNASLWQKSNEGKRKSYKERLAAKALKYKK